MADTSIVVRTAEAGRYVFLCIEGQLATREAFQTRKRAIEHHPGLPRLWDFRRADFSHWTQDEIRALAESFGATEDDRQATRVAALVSRDIEFGISRMFEVLAEEATVDRFAVFRNEREAVGWLFSAHGASAD